MNRRQRDRQAALDAALHAHAIKRALETTKDEALQQALIRLGPIPPLCRRCNEREPRAFLVYGSGEWLCNECAHGAPCSP